MAEQDAGPVRFIAVSDFNKVFADMERLRATAVTADAAVSRIGSNTAGLTAAQQNMAASASRMEALASATSRVGRGLTVGVTLPILGVGAAALKAAVDFETAFTGVTKTVDATDAELAQLEDGIRQMATEIPASTTELSAIAEAAGQLGIQVPNILGFTRAITDIASATNLTADEAATGFAQLANIMGTAQDQFSNLASAVVDLGNKGASTERDILEFGLRIAGAGEIAGLTEAQVLGIGSAMASVGIEAEAGGTAVQKVLIGITQAVSTGNEDLAKFAEVAGLSARDFATAWEEDAGQAFALFVEGLGRAGDDAFTILEDLDLTDQRLIRSFLSLANAGGLLTEQMNISTDAFAANTANSEEAERRYATMASQLAILKNNFKDVAITLGEALMPFLVELVKILRESVVPFIKRAVEAFAALPEGMRRTIVIGGLLAAALGPVLLLLGGMASGIATIMRAMAAFSGTAGVGGMVSSLGGLGAVLKAHPLLALAGVLTGAIAGVVSQSPELQAKFSGLFTRLSEALSPVVEALMPALISIVDALVPVIETLAEALIPIIEALLPALIPLLEVTADVLVIVADGLAEVLKFLTPVIEFLAELVGGLADVIGAVFSGDWGSIGGIISGALDDAGRAIDGWVQDVGAWFSEAGSAQNGFIEAIKQGWQQIVDFFGRVGDEIGRRVQSVVDFFQRFAAEVGNRLQSVADFISRFVDEAGRRIEMIAEPFIRVTGWIVGLWMLAWEKIAGFLSPIWERIKSVVSNAIEVVRNVISVVIENAKNVWTAAWEAIRNVIQTVTDRVKSILAGVKTAIDNFVNFFRTGINAIKGFFEGMIAPIKKVVDTVVGFLDKINPWHRSSPSLVMNVESGVDAIKDAYESLDGMKLAGPQIDKPERKFDEGYNPGDPGFLARENKTYRAVTIEDFSSKFKPLPVTVVGGSLDELGTAAGGDLGTISDGLGTVSSELDSVGDGVSGIRSAVEESGESAVDAFTGTIGSGQVLEEFAQEIGRAVRRRDTEDKHIGKPTPGDPFGLGGGGGFSIPSTVLPSLEVRDEAAAFGIPTLGSPGGLVQSVDAATGNPTTYIVNNPVAEETEESLREIAIRRTYLGPNATDGPAVNINKEIAIV